MYTLVRDNMSNKHIVRNSNESSGITDICDATGFNYWLRIEERNKCIIANLGYQQADYE